MENPTENEARRPAEPSAAEAGGDALGAVTRGRKLAIGLVLVVGVALVATFLFQRKPTVGPPGWVNPPDGAPAIAAQLEANVRRMLDRESTGLAAAADRAGRVPGLAALLASSIDGAAFQQALSSEPWWKEFRGYGCAVLVGDDVKAVWQLPDSGLPPAELARAVAAAPGARVVSGPNGFVLGAMAPIAGATGARVLLVEALDRRKVARMAARANVVMMLSDGHKDLGASLPDDSVPLVEGLVGKETSPVQLERRLRQLAVAVPWAPGLWLWIVSGLEE